MRLTLEQRTAALLALVDEYRQRRCAELLEPARAQARAELRKARTVGRRRVRATIAEARQRLAEQIGAAEARLATERRLALQRQARLLLQRAWTALRPALFMRWRDPAARAAWLAEHLARALQALPPAGWRIDFPADWPPAEREDFAARLAAAGIADLSWQPHSGLDGGIRIRAGSNVVDATIDGLLADRAAIEGRLLDLLFGAAAQPNRDVPAETAEAAGKEIR